MNLCCNLFQFIYKKDNKPNNNLLSEAMWNNLSYLEGNFKRFSGITQDVLRRIEIEIHNFGEVRSYILNFCFLFIFYFMKLLFRKLTLQVQIKEQSLIGTISCLILKS